MKTRFFMKLCLFSLLVWCVSSCKSDNGDSVRPIALECMYTHLTDMTNTVSYTHLDVYKRQFSGKGYATSD